MTGPEHYREAQWLARQASDYEGLPNDAHVQAARLAQVHATLASAAATLAAVTDPHWSAFWRRSDWEDVLAL